MITFNHNGNNYVVQSHLKNDFANICQINGDSFRIDFINQNITTSSKETKKWNEIADSIHIPTVQLKIDNLLSNEK